MTLAITGATGQLGRLVIDTLKTKTAPEGIIALVRNTDKAADLGVPARVFDYDAPETLAAALDGIDTLLLISGSDIGRRVPQHAAVIEAAGAAACSISSTPVYSTRRTARLALPPSMSRRKSCWPRPVLAILFCATDGTRKTTRWACRLRWNTML